MGSTGLEYLPTFTHRFMPNVGKYTIHGYYGIGIDSNFRCTYIYRVVDLQTDEICIKNRLPEACTEMNHCQRMFESLTALKWFTYRVY